MSASFTRANAQTTSRSAADLAKLRFTRDSLRIYLLTIGPGDEVWELFGHNAIWVHDPSDPIDMVYNWGVFDFRTPGFVPRFLRGDMRYSMGVDPFDATVAMYHSLNRQVWAQELNLTAPEKKALVAFVHWNMLSENEEYRYDYYLDNCSTRVRDAIDRVTGGQVRPQLQAIKTGETYRSHSLRLMQHMQPMVSGVELVLGRRTDVELTADETSFLPVQLMQHLRPVKLDGGKRTLIGDEFVINQATREAEPANVPKLWKGFLAIGLAIAGLIVWLGESASAGRARRRVLASVVAVVAGLFGIVGLIITLLVTVTDHVAAHGNENITMLNPVWLVVAVLAPMLILNGRARTATMRVALVGAGLGLAAVVIHAVGLSRQPNWDVIGLVLPVELAIAFVVATRYPSTTREPPAAPAVG